jgi:hypothetical protein
MAFSLTACTTPSGKMYFSKDKGVSFEKASTLIKNAQEKTDSFPDIQYTYAFFVECETKEQLFKLGTENVISLSGRGTENAKGHRVNTLNSLKNGTMTKTDSEEFFYGTGKIYTKRFGKFYYSEMPLSEFIPYTEYSTMSVNTDYLNEIFYNNVTVYNRFGDVTEIAFTKPEKYLTDAIISFIGLDKTDYKYTIYDVVLSVIIEKDGHLSEKHLTFNVDYYYESDPDNVLTYKGDFAYTVNKTAGIEVAERSKANNYQPVTNIHLLSSLTLNGYDVLTRQDAIDVTYKKYIKATDLSGTEYLYDADLRITAAMKNGLLHFSSIDTENFKKDESFFNTVGIFINENGYTERVYDYIKNETENSTDNKEHTYTNDQLWKVIIDAIAAERLFEEEILSIATKEEDAESVTYSIRLDPNSIKTFSTYLLETFKEGDEEGLDTTQYGFSCDKCTVEIKVRKGDGCILNQLIDYDATLYGLMSGGEIHIEGRCEMTVNSTDANLPLLNVSDWQSIVDENKAS